MEELIKNDECLDDLQNGYMLIQKNDTFKFGVDAVLLADFAEVKKSEHVLEMGTGTGIIPILLHAKKQQLQ
jgi:tRNA1(Val) A37 N6-methylase TrmN6